MSTPQPKLTEERNPNHVVQRELKNIEELKAMLDDGGMLLDEDGNIDEKLLLDTIEGNTNLHEMLLEIEELVAEHEAQAKVIDLRIADMNARKTRHKSTAGTLRTIILAAMDRTGIKTIQGTLATLTVKKKAAGLKVTDESLIPSDYFKQVAPKLDRANLKKALKDGAEIEGAELEPEGVSLQIRRG